MADNELGDEIDRRGAPCRCTPRLAAIESVAAEYDFTYSEALDYVITLGLAHVGHPPEAVAQEPGE